jgi:outer membrane protein
MPSAWRRAVAALAHRRRNAVLAARQSYLGVNSGLAQVKALEEAEISSQSALEGRRCDGSDETSH